MLELESKKKKEKTRPDMQCHLSLFTNSCRLFLFLLQAESPSLHPLRALSNTLYSVHVAHGISRSYRTSQVGDKIIEPQNPVMPY